MSIKNRNLKILKLLQHNTDIEHPITQAKLRELLGEEEAKEVLGDKGTFARQINELADYYNRDSEGNLLPKEEWRIVFPGYNRDKASNTKNGKIYYNQAFSHTEIDFLINQVRHANLFNDEEKESLEKRIIDNLANKYYEYPEKDEPFELIKTEHKQIDSELQDKICMLRDHISNRLMVEMVVENIGSLKPIRVSPYRLVFRDDYYWLIGNCHERVSKNYKKYYTNEYTCYRIDLIKSIKTAHTPYETQITENTPKYGNIYRGYIRYRRYEGCVSKARCDKECSEYQIDRLIEQTEFTHGKDFGSTY